MAKKTSAKRRPQAARKRNTGRTQARAKPQADRRKEEREPDVEVTDIAAAGIPMVVGVGASAGGLEAFSQVLEALPSDVNLALVFVQHLSPRHESALPTLLAGRTSLPVIQVTEGLQIEPQHVYVIPPNTQMGIVDGALRLLPRSVDRSHFAPIDFFFQSLAAWAHDRAVGVILSGTASDGTAGIREIKAAGGITIAQKPETAKYDGMPRSAMASGMVDLVLSPQEIAEHLTQIHMHPYVGQRVPDAAPQELGTSDEQLGQIFTLLRRVSGVDFRQYKPPTVRRRLLRRMALHRLTDADAYIRYLRENVKEVNALYQDLLIHVTRFFRDSDAFEALHARVFPELVDERSEDDPIRIWVPGCATGEDGYSVAVALMEVLGERSAGRRIQIFATDVSEGAIEHARAGVYPLGISADVSPERLKRFFSKADGGYKVNKALRDACVFARHDLTRDPPFSRLDLIVCRNVMIYLDTGMQKRLISVFHYALRSQGYLMLGPAETPGHQHLFSVVDKRWRLYRKAAIDQNALPLGFSLERFPHLPSPHVTHPISRKGDRRTVHDEASRVLLQRYGPPSVVVDDGLQIVQFRGQTGPYLEPASGEPNLNILKMVREGLLFPLRSALQAARRKHRSVRREGLVVRRNGDWHKVNLEVVPLNSAGPGHVLVTFEDAGDGRRRGRTPHRREPVAVNKRETDERVDGLTRELAASREYLQSIIQELEAANEELQSANEEILSSNEELQSTNEELDTAKEELQSTNEELNTVNEELHSRNEELSRVNSDLVNLLATADNTILIVGEDLRIRRFTPTAERVLNLIPGDVGRPVGQINTNLVSENIEALTRETIDTMVPRELEVQDRQGRWYALRIRPYKNVDNRIDGAVLSLMDIEAIKRYQLQLQHSREHLLAAVAIMHEPVLVLDDGMNVKLANRAFGRTFQLEPDRLVGLHVLDLGDKRWASPQLRSLIQQVQRPGGGVEDVVVDHDYTAAGPRRLRVSARQFLLDESRWTVMAFQVVTDAEERGQ